MPAPKVIHLASELTGGAGIAALRLHRSVLETGVDSRLIFGKGQSADPGTARFAPEGSLPHAYLDRALDQWNWRSIRKCESLFTRTHRWVSKGIPSILEGADLVHVHWIAKWLDFRSLFDAIPLQTPVVLSLHDSSFFSGGCHQPDGCVKFETACRACPKRRRNGPLIPDLARSGFSIRHAAYAGRKIIAVPNSAWTRGLAARAALLNDLSLADPIYPGVDTSVFSPLDKATCRKVLSVPNDKFVIVAGCADLFDPNKGIQRLLEALALLPEKIRSNTAILTYGSGILPGRIEGVPIYQVGFVGSERLLSLVYSAADVFCTPSMMETFGMTVVEALSCGIPVVAFETGAIPEIINHRSNGWLARVGDVRGLIEGLTWAFELGLMGSEEPNAFRASVVEGFDIAITGKQFAHVYDSALEY